MDPIYKNVEQTEDNGNISLYGSVPERPSDTELSAYSEWKQIEDNLKTQLGYVSPEELPDMLNNDWETEYQKRTGLRWRLMEPYATRSELQAKSDFTNSMKAAYLGKLQSITRDINNAKSLWMTDRKAKIKEEQLKLKQEKKIQDDPILRLHKKAKEGDMEAWNELFNIQRGMEREQEYLAEQERIKEASKPKRMTEREKYLFSERKKSIEELNNEINKLKPLAHISTKKQEMDRLIIKRDAIRQELLNELGKYEASSVEEEPKKPKLTKSIAKTYLRTHGMNEDEALKDAERDGWEVK